MIEQLNPEQRTAVTTDAQYVLVLAGAGSGKTKVLTTRMAWLIQHGLVGPHGILAVTFTNKAAKEMLSRIGAILPINTRAMWVGTFHGLCNRLLRTHYRDAGLPQGFQILDMSDQLSVIKRLIKQHNIDSERFPAKDVQRFINGQKEKGLRPSAIHPYDAHEARLVEIYHLYQQQCDKEGSVDFAELLLRAFELLKNNGLIREHYQRRFAHVLVDEFQDTNDLQYGWLRLLAGNQSAIFAVGDDDQSIYAFRGANVGNMQAFERDYARGNIVRLEQNYRSYNNILNSANALIEHNHERLGKNLWTDQGEGEPVRVIELSSDKHEAQWILEEAKNLIKEGYVRQEIAVLYRSNAQSRAIEHAFFSAGLPYRVYGGLRFFERQEVKHVLAYLRLINHLDDDTSFLRVVNFPARGIGARTLENLSDAAQKIGCSLGMAVGALNNPVAKKLAQFVQLIQQMQEDAKTLSLPELVQYVVETSGIKKFYESEREGEDRLDNLSELVNAAQVFVFEENFEGIPALEEVLRSGSDEIAFSDTISALAMFISHASLEAGDNQAKHGEDAIQLMTVHSAKGLEFDAVFVAGLEQGLFPHENSVAVEGGLEEERRLMYVAITRARQRLYLCAAHERMLYGQTRYTQRSSFLEEIPEQYTKWLSPKEITYARPNWSSGAGKVGAYGRHKHDVNSGSYYPKEGSAAETTRNLSNGVQVGDRVFKIAQTVHHAKFGEGMIIGLNGQGQDAQAQIVFQRVGPKTLALGIAKLEIIK